jgi:hypothetical protein
LLCIHFHVVIVVADINFKLNYQTIAMSVKKRKNDDDEEVNRKRISTANFNDLSSLGNLSQTQSSTQVNLKTIY